MASGPVQISEAPVSRLVQSTGNLYWSCNGAIDDDAASYIFRASKSNQPGQETQIYAETETGSGAGEFGALTWAKVGDDYFGYFVADYPGGSQIKRIPLGGGEAVVLADAPAVIGSGDLVTDGAHLCWADAGGIRSMPLGGGTTTTLAAGTGFSRLAVYGGSAYYIDGATVRGVPAGGGTASTAVTASGPITALWATQVPAEVALIDRPVTEGPVVAEGPPVFPGVEIFWGQADGSVHSIASGRVAQYQAPAADTTVTGVYSTQTRVLWADQYVGSQGFQCHVRMSAGGATTTLYSDGSELNIRDVQADAEAAYWPDIYVQKYTF